MKLTQFTRRLLLSLALTVAVAGCHPGKMKPIPGARTKNPNDNPFADLVPAPAPTPTNDLGPVTQPLPDPSKRKDWPRDAKIFEANTIHFDFDSSAIKAGEKPKAAAVADYLKAHPQDALEIDGHCDERGTEEYNRSLGERRALALREEVIRLGIDPMLIDTVSYGKDKPIADGHDEAAWKQNRRGEFLLETPPTSPVASPR